MRIFAALALLLLLACSKKSGSPTGPSEKTPYDWSLNLSFETAFDTIAQNATLSAPAQGDAVGQVNHFDDSILADTIYFTLVGNPVFRFPAVLNTAGDFTFKDSALLGKDYGPIGLNIFVHAKNTGYRPVPDTLHVTLNRRLLYPWSLDMNFAGTSFFALQKDTSFTDTATMGVVSGKVNNFNNAILIDTLYFRTLEYPNIFWNAPLDSAGAFQFNAYDFLGAQDGSMTVYLLMKPKTTDYQPTPDTLKILLNIP